jgi:replicative DNA helicase
MKSGKVRHFPPHIFLTFSNLYPEFLSLAEQNKSLDAECIRTWLKDVDSLTKILTRYGDQESLKQLSDQQEMLKDLLQGLGIEVMGGNKSRTSI